MELGRHIETAPLRQSRNDHCKKPKLKFLRFLAVIRLALPCRHKKDSRPRRVYSAYEYPFGNPLDLCEPFAFPYTIQLGPSGGSGSVNGLLTVLVQVLLLK